jgi:hypothetical protein
MKTHVLMFDVRFQSETNKPASIEEINMIESIINKALGNIATAKLARNVTADYTEEGKINQHLLQNITAEYNDDYTECFTEFGLINQPLHQTEENKNK